MKKSSLAALFLVLALTLSLFPSAGAGLVEEIDAKATAALLVEGSTGEILYEKNAREKRYPASITKVMTAMLVLEAVSSGTLEMNQMITANASAMEGLSSDGSTQNIKAGEQMTVKDLLFCTLVASANEACNILAEAVSGTKADFVELMNRRAQELGMKGTYFVNAHGLHNDNHYTTAYDIYLMGVEAMKDPHFREIVATVDHYVPQTNLHDQRHFYNTNALLTSWRYLGYTYRNAIGIKTGSTPEAGQCLLSAAEQDGRTIYAIILGAENVETIQGDKTLIQRENFSESKRLLEIGFRDFASRTVLTSMDLQGEVAVTLSKTEQVVAAPAGTLTATLPKDVTAEDILVTPIYDADTVEAPVAKGQRLGTVSVRYGDQEIGTLELVAVNEVHRDEWMYRISLVKAFFGQIWVKIVLGLLLIALAVFFVRGILLHRGRGRRRTPSAGRYRGGRR